MPKTTFFSLKRFIKSVGYALAGLMRMVKSEQNARIHIIAACGAIACGGWLQISAGEWVIVVGAIVCVIAAELFNSSVETLADRISPEYDEAIKHAKDFAAAGVLVVAIGAAVAGAIIFVPRIVAMCP